MPVYFFGLPDDLASPEVREELADDAEARQVAQIVANDLSRDRYDGEQVAVLVFNNSRQLIHKVWTWPAAITNPPFQNMSTQKDFTKSEGAFERPVVANSCTEKPWKPPEFAVPRQTLRR